MNPESQQTQYEEDSIDLRSYILTLIRYWPLIVGMTLLAAVAAGVVSLLQTPVYEASARLVIIQSKETTLSQDSGLQRTDADVQARRNALAGLVQNVAIAQTVISRLGNQIPPDLHDIGRLVGSVKGRVVQGDLIEIAVRSTNPVTAALIANALGEEYERYVNLVYTGRAGEGEAARVQRVVKTKSGYDTAQQALIEFLAGSRIDELERLVQEKEQLVSRLAQAGIDSYTTVFDQQVEERINNLVRAYSEKTRIELLLDDARALLGQTEGGGDAATSTNALALMLLKVEVFASSTALPGELQITLGAVSGLETNAADQQADVTALVSVLETRLAEIDEDIQVQSATLLGDDYYHLLTELTASQLAVSAPLTQTITTSQPVSEMASSFSPAIAQLQEDVRALQSGLEAETSKQQELTRARDLALEMYTAVARKEADVDSAVTGTIVRFAVPAVEPLVPVGAKTRQNVLLAGVAGFLVAVGAAFFIDYMKSGYDQAAA